MVHDDDTETDIGLDYYKAAYASSSSSGTSSNPKKCGVQNFGFHQSKIRVKLVDCEFSTTVGSAAYAVCMVKKGTTVLHL